MAIPSTRSFDILLMMVMWEAHVEAERGRDPVAVSRFLSVHKNEFERSQKDSVEHTGFIKDTVPTQTGRAGSLEQ